MPFVEYVLLAILGSAGAATPGGAPGTTPRTLGADAVVQPSGGTGLLGQAGGGSTDTTTPPKGRKVPRTRTSARHHRRGHKGGKVTKPIEGSKNAQRKI